MYNVERYERGLKRYPKAGWKAMLGVIHPEGAVAGPNDFRKLAPPGVAMSLLYVPLHKDESTEEMMKLGDRVVEVASGRSFRQWQCDVILWLCTAGSFLKGIGYDQQLIKGIQDATGIPATTTSTAIMEAFKALKITRLIVVTPYPASANALEKKFIEGNGVEVLQIEGFEDIDHRDLISRHPHDYYELLKRLDRPEADGLFISCTGLDVMDLIEPLEQELGKPVVTSNQASFWKAFSMGRVTDPISGYGKLFRIQR